MNCRISNYTGIKKTFKSPKSTFFPFRIYWYGNNICTAIIKIFQRHDRFISLYIIFFIIACYCSKMDASKDHGTTASIIFSSQTNPKKKNCHLNHKNLLSFILNVLIYDCLCRLDQLPIINFLR